MLCRCTPGVRGSVDVIKLLRVHCKSIRHIPQVRMQNVDGARCLVNGKITRALSSRDLGEHEVQRAHLRKRARKTTQTQCKSRPQPRHQRAEKHLAVSWQETKYSHKEDRQATSCAVYSMPQNAHYNRKEKIITASDNKKRFCTQN